MSTPEGKRILRVTHTGATKGSLYLSDLDQDDFTPYYKVPNYIPENQTVDIPITDSVILSLNQGYLKKFLDLGFITIDLISDPASAVTFDSSSLSITSDNVQDALEAILSEAQEGSIKSKVRVRNETGSTLSKGTLIGVVGYSIAEDVMLVDKASRLTPTLRPTLGALEEDLGNNETGLAVSIGLLEGIDTSAWSISDQLVLGTNGDFERPPPETDPFHGEVQNVGFVTRVGDSTTGQLYMDVEGLLALTADEIFNAERSLLRGYESGGDITFPGGLDVSVTGGIGYVSQANNQDRLQRVNWSADTITLPANSYVDVYIDADGTLSAAPRPVNLDQNIILATFQTDTDSIIFGASHQTIVPRKNERDHFYAKEVIGPTTVSGGTTTINGGDPLALDVDSAVYYIADDRKEVSASTGAAFNYWYRDGSGGWNVIEGQTQIDTAQYDDGSGTLVSLPAGEWKKDEIYLAKNNGSVEYHVVYGQETFVDQVSAENGARPVPPTPVNEFSLRSGGIVSQESAASIGSIVDSRPFLGQLSSGLTSVSDHGLLAGLGDDDHPQYVRTDGTRPLAGDLDLGSNSVVNVNLVDNVDVSNHSTRHDPAGSDPLATATPVAIGESNVEGTANSYARSDHQHDHGDLPGGTLHADATPSVDGFMSAADKTKLDGIEANAKDDQTITAGTGLNGGGTGDVTLNTSLANNQATATGVVTTTSTTDILLTGMTITPGAGTYLAIFSGVGHNNTNNENAFFSLYVGGTKLPHTERSVGNPNLIYKAMSFQSIVTPGAGQAVEVRWRVSANTGNARERTLTLIRIA